MVRYAPGTYHLINQSGTSVDTVTIDNEKLNIADQCTITVLVRNTMLADISGNLQVHRLSGSITTISGNATKWTA